MKPDYEHRLEGEIDRWIKQMPERPAPPTLLPRVMARARQRAEAAWYRRAWPAWPAAWRFASLVLLAALATGLFLGGRELVRPEWFAAAGHRAAAWSAPILALWNVLHVCYETLALLLGHLHPGLLAGCGIALALAYALSIALGTLCVRFGFAQHRSFRL